MSEAVYIRYSACLRCKIFNHLLVWQIPSAAIIDDTAQETTAVMTLLVEHERMITPAVGNNERNTSYIVKHTNQQCSINHLCMTPPNHSTHSSHPFLKHQTSLNPLLCWCSSPEIHFVGQLVDHSQLNRRHDRIFKVAYPIITPVCMCEAGSSNHCIHLTICQSSKHFVISLSQSLLMQ